MKFRKKPVVIDAVQWTGENHREMFNFLGSEDADYVFSLCVRAGLNVMRSGFCQTNKN